MKPKKSLISKFFLSILYTIIILIGFFGIHLIVKEYRNFSIDSKKTTQQYIKTQKGVIKNEVEKVIDYITYKRNSSEEILKKLVKSRVYEAYSTVENIYKQNYRKKSNREIKSMIIDALRPVRYHNKRCYYFIDDIKGRALMSPVDPGSENKMYINLQDAKGKFVIRDFIEIAKTQNEGYISYYAPIPETDTTISIEEYEKLSYIKHFEPYGWIIGTGDYLQGDKADLQKELLNRISKIIYNEDESIFITDYEGEVLVFENDTVVKANNIFTSSFTSIKDNEIKEWLQKPEGCFVNRDWENAEMLKNTEETYYIKVIPDWGWIIGAELNYEKIYSSIQIEKADLAKRVKKQIIEIILLLIITLLIGFLLIKKLSRTIQKNVNVFISFFKEATKKFFAINIANLNFLEFETLAESANSMIEERKKIKKALQLEEVYLKELFENSPEGIVLADKDHIILKINPGFTKIFGYTSKEVIGKSIDDLIASGVYLDEANELSKRVAKKEFVIKETVRRNKKGESIDVSLLGVPIYLEKDQIAMYGIYRDITKQKRSEKELIKAKEKAEEADKLKTSFLTNMSHEIRTPMNAIIGFSDLLTNKNISQKEKNECIDFIKNSSNNLLELIDAIIDIAKIEAGQIKIDKSECLVNSMLNSFFNDTKSKLFKNMPLDFKLKIGLDNPDFAIHTDIQKLKQILSSLVKNAIKFTEEGYVEIGYEMKDDSILEFYVKDTGIGITIKAQKIIFESFRQLDDSETRKYEGTGIGLTIAKNLVELLGGKIWLESTSGKGTTFYFTLPVS